MNNFSNLVQPKDALSVHIPDNDSDVLLTEWTNSSMSDVYLLPNLSVSEHSTQDEATSIDVDAPDEESGCDCMARAWLAASQLEKCLRTKEKNGLEVILSTCRSGIEICKRANECTHQHRRIFFPLCIEIMDLVAQCYDGINVNATMEQRPSITLRIHEIELSGLWSPHLVRAVVHSERHQAAAACNMLESAVQARRQDEQDLILDHFARLIGGLKSCFVGFDPDQ